MSDTYTKLFSGIVTSTIVDEPLATRWLWVTMLALADARGNVYASIPGLARVANLSRAETEAGLKCFLSPDPDSRTKDFNGRRIEAFDGGYKLLNHHKYSAIRSAEERAEYKREWDRANRGNRPRADYRTPDSTPDLPPTKSDDPTPPALDLTLQKQSGGHTASSEGPPADKPPARALEPGTAACIAMRRLGVEGVNPHHPDLLALVAKGLTAEEAEATAAECIGKGKPRFAYVLAAIRGRREAAREAPEAAAPRVVRSPAGNSPEKPPEPAELAALRFKRDLHRLGRLSDEEMAEAQRAFDATHRRQA